MLVVPLPPLQINLAILILRAFVYTASIAPPNRCIICNGSFLLEKFFRITAVRLRSRVGLPQPSPSDRNFLLNSCSSDSSISNANSRRRYHCTNARSPFELALRPSLSRRIRMIALLFDSLLKEKSLNSFARPQLGAGTKCSIFRSPRCTSRSGQTASWP